VDLTHEWKLGSDLGSVRRAEIDFRDFAAAAEQLRISVGGYLLDCKRDAVRLAFE